MRLRARRYPKVIRRLFLALGSMLLVAANSRPQGQPKAAKAEGQHATPLITSVEGPDLYRAYCASCHGANGKGDGPVARALKVAPPDLTRLSGKGQFPTERVRQTILGDAVVAAHGTREMPIWGPVFHQIEADVDRGNVRTENLLKYLQSIQAVASTQPAPVKKNSSENTPSGAQLYKQFCAACHGNDLKGNGPGPAPFKDVPPGSDHVGPSPRRQFPRRLCERRLAQRYNDSRPWTAGDAYMGCGF